MKKIVYLLLGLFFIACTNSNSNKTTDSFDENALFDSTQVVAYYFHGKQRCKTCVTIQQIAQETVQKKFTDLSKVKFVEIDFSEKKNDAIAEKYEISWSSLIIATKSEYVNLTDLAFANALTNPATLSDEIISTINTLIN
jgi:hypothetical protein